MWRVEVQCAGHVVAPFVVLGRAVVLRGSAAGTGLAVPAVGDRSTVGGFTECRPGQSAGIVEGVGERRPRRVGPVRVTTSEDLAAAQERRREVLARPALGRGSVNSGWPDPGRVQAAERSSCFSLALTVAATMPRRSSVRATRSASSSSRPSKGAPGDVIVLEVRGPAAAVSGTTTSHSGHHEFHAKIYLKASELRNVMVPLPGLERSAHGLGNVPTTPTPPSTSYFVLIPGTVGRLDPFR
jgi:hypothetical protein